MNKDNYISVEELQGWNPGVDFSAYSTTVLSGVITRAADYVDEYLNYSLKVEDISGEKCKAQATTDGDLIIFTKKIPIISVSSIGLKLGTYSTDLSIVDGDGSAKYDIPDSKQHIRYPYSQIELSGSVSLTDFYQIRSRDYYSIISYKAGYYTIPSALKDAVNLVALDMLKRQTANQRISSMSQGAISISYSRGESELLKEAKEILDKYRKITY